MLSNREKVIITLTTISSRINNIDQVLETLLKQDYINYEIRLYISREAYLLDKGIDDVPSKYLNDERLKIIYVENTGPYRKLMPALKEFFGTNQILITVDDDVLYPQNFISTLILANQIYDCPIAYRGRKITISETKINPYKQWEKNNLTGCSFSHLPTGKDGVLYRPSYFHKNVLDISQAIEIAPTTDDLWFKWHTVLNNKKSVLLFNTLSESFDITEETNETLFDSFNKHTNNDQIVESLEKNLNNKFQFNLFQKLNNILEKD